MCRDCGCQIESGEHEHLVNGKLVRHTHAPEPALAHGHRKFTLEQSVLAKNDRIAVENRIWFKQNGICVLNLISSPGSGKTLLLERKRSKCPI